tara:strand:- start:6993 stop:7148 length:156 start_codon:yes stop_codon:yes gene_type:complete
MWLDYCDEHKQPLGGEKLLSYEEYLEKYQTWLHQRYVERINNTFGILYARH